MNIKSTLDILTARRVSPAEFYYDDLVSIPLNYLIDLPREERLYNIATSLRYNADIDKKYKEIKSIMEPLGFRSFTNGTNRMVFQHLDIQNIIVKIAIDRSGTMDAPSEMIGQNYIKPYCSKTFERSPSGTVGLFERVVPIRSKYEFSLVADNIFDIIVNKLIGKVILDDFGSDSFMNWGVRDGFGPVILDYPYVYPIDSDKLYCNRPNPYTGIPCGGEIDYDNGFNNLYCTCCGAKYAAKYLSKDISNNSIIIKGVDDMKVVVYRNGILEYESEDSIPKVNVFGKVYKPHKEHEYATSVNAVGKYKNMKERGKKAKQKISEHRKEAVQIDKGIRNGKMKQEEYNKAINEEEQLVEDAKMGKLYTSNSFVNNNMDTTIESSNTFYIRRDENSEINSDNTNDRFVIEKQKLIEELNNKSKDMEQLQKDNSDLINRIKALEDIIMKNESTIKLENNTEEKKMTCPIHIIDKTTGQDITAKKEAIDKIMDDIEAKKVEYMHGYNKNNNQESEDDPIKVPIANLQNIDFKSIINEMNKTAGIDMTKISSHNKIEVPHENNNRLSYSIRDKVKNLKINPSQSLFVISIYSKRKDLETLKLNKIYNGNLVKEKIKC